MLQVSVASVQLPRALFIHGVDLAGQTKPTVYGGFSEIWKADYRGAAVSVKRYQITLTRKTLPEQVLARLLTERLHLSASFIFKNDDEMTQALACREAVLCSTLHHPSILTLLGVSTEMPGHGYCLVTPWVRGLTLFTDNYEDTMHRSRLVRTTMSRWSFILLSQCTALGDRRWSGLPPFPACRAWKYP
jgi:serine/threonine protein kinase